jgi:hypothetical protein
MYSFIRTHTNQLIRSIGIVILLSVHSVYADNNTPEESLPFKAMVIVRWEIDQNVTVNQGNLQYRIGGTLELDKSGTKEVKTKTIPSAFPFVTYRPTTMRVVYSYNEFIYEKDPGNCPPLTAMYQKEMGAFYLESGVDDPARAELHIRKFGSMIPEGYELPNIPDMPQQMTVCDYYEYYAAGPQQTISGKERGSDCKYKAADKEVIVCRLGLRFQLPKDGAIYGKREWSAKAEQSGLTFKISLSDLPAPLSDEEYHPAAASDGDITYYVIWGIGEQGVSEFDNMMEGKNKDRDCEALQRRIDFIDIVRKVYANDKLRQYAKDNFSDTDEAIEKYQSAVEKLSMKISTDPEIKNPNVIDDYLDDLSNTDVVKAFEPTQGGTAEAYLQTKPEGNRKTNSIYSVSILVYREGVPIELRAYDGNGAMKYETQELGRMEMEWVNDYWRYSTKVGQALFRSCLAHEETHVQQYVKKKFIKSVDDLAGRELEAYQVEKNKIKEYRTEMGCD